MEPLYELSSVRRLLRDGITKGYWTLEDLDTPPPGSISPKHRNLLRDPEPPQERVQLTDPRDFDIEF